MVVVCGGELQPYVYTNECLGYSVQVLIREVFGTYVLSFIFHIIKSLHTLENEVESQKQI